MNNSITFSASVDECAPISDFGRVMSIVDRLIDELELDLSGLAVFTEAASGPYLWTPLIAARAGARAVYAYAQSSHYASADDVEKQTRIASQMFGKEHVIRILRTKDHSAIADSDIVTNSGFVRPIDEAMISRMKATSVIPLMWESWEFRSEDLDLDACKRKGILVLGTNEHSSPCDMTGYSGMAALKLLFDLNIEVYRSSVIVLGGQFTLAEAMVKQLNAAGCKVAWFSGVTGKGEPYEQLAEFWMKNGAKCDAIIVAEHADHRTLIGRSGFVSFEQLLKINPHLRIGIVSGNVSSGELRDSGLRFLPERLRPAGYQTYSVSELGPRPVLDLYAAGLKVGQSAVRARLRGATVEQAAQEAIRIGPAMDLEGTRSWLSPSA